MAVGPRRSRPGFGPEYGIAEGEEGMLDWGWAEERLAASRNYWIATSGEDGAPASAPVWGVWHGGAVWFGTSPSSRKGRNLARDPRVVVHLESGNEVVILYGEVERVPLEEAVADAYEVKYDYRPDQPEFLRLRPRRAVAWTESEYPQTATRFDFDS
jgi:nitroimidazol reductase NimA-like FMN-containing flavoprotein (pyridoxamine 5'-phosphate oxidase superfamily)